MQEAKLSKSLSLGSMARVAILLAVTALAARASAQSYNFNLLYDFTGNNGTNPYSALIMDASGNLYGTTSDGGANGGGTVFEMVNSSGTYTEQILYSFSASESGINSDGCTPYAGLVTDGSGNLYGTTAFCGASGDGTVFELQNNGGGNYTFNLLYAFTGGNDGEGPLMLGTLARDAAGNLYGTTTAGGIDSDGTVFELVNTGGGSGSGPYTERVLYSFTGANDGAGPESTVVLDANGNLFGTTVQAGANQDGVVYELANSGSGNYTFRTLYAFTGGSDGTHPLAAVTLDAAGNLYGTTVGATFGGGSGTNQYGSVYELVNSSGTYQEKTLYDFANANGDGSGPLAPVTLDAAGDVFGTTAFGGSTSANAGTVFELVNSSGSYQEQILYTFTGGADGQNPTAGLLADAYGNLFGDSYLGGISSGGSVWEMLSPASATSMQLASSLNPVSSGNGVTFTASIAVSPAGTPIAGTVTFSEGSTVLGSAAVANGSASVTVDATTLGAGADTISAQFASSTSHQTGSNASIVQTVNAVAFTGGSNTFTGNQTVNGSLSATGFSGSGAGLTNVTASGLACAGCVTNSQLGVNYAGSNTQGGAATSALNSLTLGGLPASSFATLDSNSFTGDQSINGNLTVTGNISGKLSPGSLTIGGGTAITEYVSITDTIRLPAINPGQCTTFQTAALAGFTPGNDDTLSLGIPSAFLAGLNNNPGHGPAYGPGQYNQGPGQYGQGPGQYGQGPNIFLVYQAWETTSSASPTITLQVCNPSTPYRGGASGTIRIDVFKH